MLNTWLEALITAAVDLADNDQCIIRDVGGGLITVEIDKSKLDTLRKTVKEYRKQFPHAYYAKVQLTDGKLFP